MGPATRIAPLGGGPPLAVNALAPTPAATHALATTSAATHRRNRLARTTRDLIHSPPVVDIDNVAEERTYVRPKSVSRVELLRRAVAAAAGRLDTQNIAGSQVERRLAV